jgi:predicted house-cleaning noncanonical NTP pyrophosphatase (MazG superfamily)
MVKSLRDKLPVIIDNREKNSVLEVVKATKFKECVV